MFTFRVEGRREQKLLGIGSSTTLPARGRREQQQQKQQQQQSLHHQQQSDSSLSSYCQSVPSCEEISISSILSSDMPPITSYDEKTVSLFKGSKGFGFVLRGAKATSPVVKQHHEVPQPQPISLQYLDEIETAGVAEAAGLKKGDFLLNVNGVDVRSAPHELVVQLIRQSGDKVTMTVASPNYLDDDYNNNNNSSVTPTGKENQKKNVPLGDEPNDQKFYNNNNDEKEFSATIPRGTAENRESRSQQKVRNPPAPPKRDPSTTLSISKATAKSLCISNSSGQVNSGLPMSSSTNSEISGQSNSNDQEGRSNRNSPPSTLADSSVSSNNVTLRSKEKDGNKTASIRSRSSRRISAVELEKFFARQDGQNGQAPVIDDEGKLKENGHQTTTLQALKKKRNKKLQKDFHSTPDIQEQLALEQAKLQLTQSKSSGQKIHYDDNANRLSTSQEDIRAILPMYSETLTLKNGKIVQDVHHDPAALKEAIRSQLTTDQLPPPLPSVSEAGVTSRPEEMSNSCSVLIKVDVSGNRLSKSDYAQMNRDETANGDQMAPSAPLSSFKPSMSSGNSESPETLRKGVNYASPEKLQQAVQQKPTKQPASTLRPAKHVKHSSFVSTQGVDSLNGDQPYIPEPDYSSSEEEAITPTYVSGRDLSTFKGTINNTANVDPHRMSVSYHESEVGSKTDDETVTANAMSKSISVPNEPSKDFNAQLKSKVASIAAGENKGSLESKLGQIEEIRVIKSTKKDERGTASEPLAAKPKGDHFNKVKESIAVFERRSSLTGEVIGTTTQTVIANPAVPAVSSTTTRSKREDANNNINDNNNNVNNMIDSSSGTNNNNNPMRVSKSCFEVDICDNYSSGISSSDIDGDNHLPQYSHFVSSQPHQQQLKSGNNSTSSMNQHIQSLNRRNSAIVSEKIATLMASGAQSPTVIRTNSQDSKMTAISSNKEQLTAFRRESIASTFPLESKDHHSDCEYNSQSTGLVKAAPTTAKTWSEISSAIRAAKGGAGVGSGVTSTPNSIAGTISATNYHAGPVNKSGPMIKQLTSMRPTSAPIISNDKNQTTSNNSSKIGQSNNRNDRSSKTSTIKSRDGLSDCNEVDSLAELAPPPPEFAAPPPQPMDKKTGTGKIQASKQQQHHHHHHQQIQQAVHNHLISAHQLHQQQQLQQQLHHHGQQTHSKMVTTLPATQGAPVNTVITVKGGQQPQQLIINNQRKEEIRIINNQQQPQAQVHIVHKPTPQQQACLYNELTCENSSQQLTRKTSTPPPPPPPEFSDLSAASRLGIVSAHLPSGHPHHHHTIHLPHHHHHHQPQPQNQQQQLSQQAKIQYAIYPENQKQTQQFQSYLQQQQPHHQQQQFVTLTRYMGKQGQQMMAARQRYNSGSGDQQTPASTTAMSRSVGSESPLTIACSGIDNVLYKVNHQGMLEPIGHCHHPASSSGGYHQFATLSRGKPQHLRVASPSPAPSSTSYSDYTRLTVQNRLLRQLQQQQQSQNQSTTGQPQPPPPQQPQPQTQIIYQANQGQPITSGHSHQYYVSDAQKQQLLQQHAQAHALHQQQMLQHQIITAQGSGALANQLIAASNYAASQPKQPAHPPPPGPPPSLQKHPATFPRRSMVDWSEEDVCDWIASIGMVEHRGQFEFINGVKLLRLDNNDLIGIGVRPGQHRCFILEKIKQHLHYQQQHPPVQQ